MAGHSHSLSLLSLASRSHSVTHSLAHSRCETPSRFSILLPLSRSSSSTSSFITTFRLSHSHFRSSLTRRRLRALGVSRPLAAACRYFSRCVASSLYLSSSRSLSLSLALLSRSLDTLSLDTLSRYARYSRSILSILSLGTLDSRYSLSLSSLSTLSTRSLSLSLRSLSRSLDVLSRYSLSILSISPFRLKATDGKSVAARLFSFLFLCFFFLLLFWAFAPIFHLSLSIEVRESRGFFVGVVVVVVVVSVLVRVLVLVLVLVLCSCTD